MRLRDATICVALTGIVPVALLVCLPQSLRQLPIEDRRAELRRLIAEQEAESAQAVAAYAPKAHAQVTDLDSPAAGILRSLPGVVQVEVCVRAEKPTYRIIHLRDWHFVPKELFVVDMADAHRRQLSEDEIDILHEQHLLEVELVQLEQMAVLRCLIRHHGLQRVFCEGFSPRELDAYREKIAVLRAMEQEQVPRIREQLENVRKLLAGSSPVTTEAKAIEAELLVMLEQHKHRLLEMGATGRLLIAGELDDVLPLEDGATLEESRPISASGVKVDSQKIEVRHDAQVRAVTREEPVAVIVLGGAHNLTNSVRRHGCGTGEYLRVTTKRFREISE